MSSADKSRVALPLTMALAVGIGGGGLLFFGLFLLFGPVLRVEIAERPAAALGVDLALSLTFFVQHSGMVRDGFRRAIARCVPDAFQPAAYAITSGLVLLAVVLLWQPVDSTVFRAEGLWRWSLRAVELLTLAGFVWAARALRRFDPFGLDRLRAAARGEVAREPTFVVRGPYRWMRHPLYSLIIVLIWSCPDISLDRLLFDVLWTAWMVIGARLEERDLVATFGARYREYQRTVPMLIPWRRAGRATLAVALQLVSMFPDNIAADDIARGDDAWIRRSAGLDEHGRPPRDTVESAIAAYEAALSHDPANIAVRLKLMEALYFLAHFVSTDVAEQRRLYDRSLALSGEVMQRLADRVGVPDLASQSVGRQIELLKNVPEAAPAHFWAGVTRGLWGLSHGNLAAARAGVATRIRDHARILIALDDTHAAGGGCRLLGRLHTVAPRVPFVSWWIDRRQGIELLRRACATSRRDPRNALFLAEALLAHEPGRRAEALELLHEAAKQEPRPEQALEDAETISIAQERLHAEEKATP